MKIFDKKRNKMEGLYDPRNEHDSCGLGFIANITHVPNGILKVSTQSRTDVTTAEILTTFF